ncbi:hypothetical protein T02_1792 [Trichinella nativa]|uniref:Uncharacterized protein n=1 Tax=Trichinella nativa TaxID=6335 RepID=A0A0V1L1Y5_9BILA|nr:hypothetical protein T02_1792 [Trichinella nativa]
MKTGGGSIFLKFIYTIIKIEVKNFAFLNKSTGSDHKNIMLHRMDTSSKCEERKIVTGLGGVVLIQFELFLLIYWYSIV